MLTTVKIATLDSNALTLVAGGDGDCYVHSKGNNACTQSKAISRRAC